MIRKVKLTQGSRKVTLEILLQLYEDRNAETKFFLHYSETMNKYAILWVDRESNRNDIQIASNVFLYNNTSISSYNIQEFIAVDLQEVANIHEGGRWVDSMNINDLLEEIYTNPKEALNIGTVYIPEKDVK